MGAAEIPYKCFGIDLVTFVADALAFCVFILCLCYINTSLSLYLRWKEMLKVGYFLAISRVLLYHNTGNGLQCDARWVGKSVEVSET
jgi:hypothetical protein